MVFNATFNNILVISLAEAEKQLGLDITSMPLLKSL
jgi:hypothetical protein